MTALPQQRMTAEEFLAWSEGQPGRYELVEGEVFSQAAERTGHADMKFMVAVALKNAIRKRRSPCHVLPDGVAVRVDKGTVFEPDAQVYCGPKLPRSTLLVEHPVVVVEVLSPSTGRNDATRKLEGYFRIPSVQHYLIVDPDEPLVFHHSRVEGGMILTRIIRDGAVTLLPPGLEIELSELYGAGV